MASIDDCFAVGMVKMLDRSPPTLRRANGTELAKPPNVVKNDILPGLIFSGLRLGSGKPVTTTKSGPQWMKRDASFQVAVYPTEGEELANEKRSRSRHCQIVENIFVDLINGVSQSMFRLTTLRCFHQSMFLCAIALRCFRRIGFRMTLGRFHREMVCQLRCLLAVADNIVGGHCWQSLNEL